MKSSVASIFILLKWRQSNMNLKGVFSHESDHWKTPKKLYDAFMSAGYTDPCPFHCTENNLDTFYCQEKLFINPPFSQMSKWVDMAIHSANRGCEVWLLMPARTDTKYFKKLADYRCTIWFFTGRLHFNDGKNSAPFPTMLVHLQDDTWENSFMHGDVDEFIRIYLED